MMLPARTKCYPGWTIEYYGYLMSEYDYSHSRHEYVCVDHAPEINPKSYKNLNGASMYIVQAMCGSLPCPPYENGQELSCVVCSKY
uniref:Uncharacterized protein n=1 Tax=Octopus bimaculoides TaxID=37653 RepID=A0A0L8G5S2_OCTBM|eukprot:XP_014783820.1 PREDICTED: uncharacterized protein LOC106878958 [Octopus bimaculoides]